MKIAWSTTKKKMSNSILQIFGKWRLQCGCSVMYRCILGRLRSRSERTLGICVS